MAVNNIGSLGPLEGKPAVYHWGFWNTAARFAPWAAVLGLLLLPRNRHRAVLLVLVWLAGVQVMFLLLNFAASLVGGDFEFLYESVGIVTAALAATWLLSGGTPAHSVWRAPLRSLLAFTGLAVLGVAAFCGSTLWGAFEYLAFVALLGGLIFLGLGMALLGCRRTCTSARLFAFAFFGFVGAGLIVCGAFGALAGMQMVVMGELAMAVFVIAGAALFGAIAGFVTFVLVSPLLGLAVGTDHFRERWAADFAGAQLRVPRPTIPADATGEPA